MTLDTKDEAAKIRLEATRLRGLPNEPSSAEILDLIAQLAALIERMPIGQVNTMIDGFMETFAEPFFEGTPIQRRVVELAKERGRQDIVEMVDEPKRRRESDRLARDHQRALMEQEESEAE